MDIKSLISQSRLVHFLALALSLTFSLQSCASKDEQAETEEAVNADGSEEGEAAANAEGEETDSEDGNSANGEEEAEAVETANDAGADQDLSDISSDANTDDVVAQGDFAYPAAQDAGEGEGDASQDNRAQQDLAAAEAVPYEAPAEEQSANYVVSSQPVTTPTAPSGDARVKYAKSTTTIYSNASQSSGRMGSLSKGDHVLVVAQGQWAQISSGGYVMMSALSDRGIGRPRSDGSWSGGN